MVKIKLILADGMEETRGFAAREHWTEHGDNPLGGDTTYVELSPEQMRDWVVRMWQLLPPNQRPGLC